MLVVSFWDQDDAAEFVQQIAASPDEIYCMPKTSLFDEHTLTLTCRRNSEVSSNEL